MAPASSRKALLMLAALVGIAIGHCATVTAKEPQTVGQLQTAGKLQIKSWVEPARAIVVNQQINFVIEVATDQWFSGGTRVGRLEVDDALVLQREQFALNSTRREQGVTRSVQQWRISIYPQRAGEYEIPALRLTLSVAGDNGKPISGELYTKPVSFEAGVPKALATLASASKSSVDWVASPAFSVNETYSRSRGEELQSLRPGDAVQRTIAFKAENVAAMMLPAVNVREQAGLATYQKPPRLTDNVNRGLYRAQRIETISYVIEKPGDYVLPELTYYWWDLSIHTLKKIVLPEQTISTANTASSDNAEQASQQTSRDWNVITATVIVTLFAMLLAWVFWHQRRRKKTQNAFAKDERLLLKKIVLASRRGDTQEAIGFLYQWLDHYPNGRFDGSIRSLLRGVQQRELISLFESLMQRVYAGSDERREVDIERFVRALDAELSDFNRTTRWGVKPILLKLN